MATNRVWYGGRRLVRRVSFTYEDLQDPGGWKGLTLLPPSGLFLVESIHIKKTQDFTHTGGKSLWVSAFVSAFNQERFCDAMMPHNLSDGVDEWVYGADLASFNVGRRGKSMAPMDVHGVISNPINNGSLGQVTLGTVQGGRAVFVPEDCLLTDMDFWVDGGVELTGSGVLTLEAVSVDLNAELGTDANFEPVGTPGDWYFSGLPSLSPPVVAFGAGARAYGWRCSGFVPGGSLVTVRCTHTGDTLSPDTADFGFRLHLAPMRGKGLALRNGPFLAGSLPGVPILEALGLMALIEGGASGEVLDDLDGGAAEAFIVYQEIR